MNTSSEGVITIVVADNQMILALVKDIVSDVDVVITSDNPRYGVLMDKLGDELRIGPIVCESKADVDRLVAVISKKPDIQTVIDDLMDDRDLLGPFRVDLYSPDVYESARVLSHFSGIPFHHQLNQHPKRPGKQKRGPKRSHKFTGGFK